MKIFPTRSLLAFTDLFPDCTHVKSVELTRADDAVIVLTGQSSTGFQSYPKILISIREASRWVHRQSLFGCV